MNVTIFGKGNMGKAIGNQFEKAGNNVDYIASNDQVINLGNIVILAVPYPALDTISKENQEKLKGKIIVDVTNPVNFDTWNGLVVPSDSSAAEQLQSNLPDSKILKAFNTNFAATLQNGKVGYHSTTVLVADENEAKQTFIDTLTPSELDILDEGTLGRARELEAAGFLQMTLAINEQISWNGGFSVIK
jgi:predicted dinucleotide-binding enzyme